MRTIFLLGGHDLEMVEIKNILSNEKYSDGKDFPNGNKLYFDFNLFWGAKWSDYAEIIEANNRYESIIYGVELTVDIDLPENCKVIDHHNDYPPQPTSIEQVAEILGIALSDYQKLVAANDHGYIPAMKLAGASDYMIQEIRFLDRKAQGVTIEMEAVAERETKQVKHHAGVLIIKTSLSKFSPITDRLQAKRLLVYNNNTLCYYGEGAGTLAKKYQDYIQTNKAFSGGGEAGFFGLVPKAFNPDEIENKFIPEILNQ